MLYKIASETESRSCQAGRPKYNSNRIQTSKYTWYTFLPRNLFEQFSKLANLYFLILGIMQAIPIISISNGQPTIFIPLIFIVFITAVKDIYEDRKRKLSDFQENNYTVQCQGQTRLWQHIHAGEIVKILNNQQVPADLLLLGTSERKGVCYIETKNLDGETNLKQKITAPNLLTYYQSETDYYTKQLTIEYDLPNQYLYRFQGAGYFDNSIYNLFVQREKIQRKKKKQDYPQRLSMIRNSIDAVKIDKFALENNNIVLRGSQIRNTQYIYGLILYAGHDTKVMLNSVKPHYKKSQLEIKLQKSIMVIFTIQLLICLFAALFYAIWYNQNSRNLEYLHIKKNDNIDNSLSYNFFVRFGNWILMFGNFVPISLLVTLEMVKFFQAIVIQQDDQTMFNGQKCAVQSSNLNEELGQIHYIFSDKTGTLTKNEMVFKKICVNGISYGDEHTGEPCLDNVDFQDPRFLKAMKDLKQQQEILKVLMILGLCHSAVIEIVDDLPKYNVTSPDELALLNFAKQMKMVYDGIDEKNIITLNMNGVELQYELLYSFEFTSERKRGSVIVRDLQENRIFLLSKGADSTMIERSSKTNQNLEAYKKYLMEYSTQGLRVLMLGAREVSQKELQAFAKEYYIATTMMEGRDEAITLCQDRIEQDFKLMGITAIEDKLQDNVDTTIEILRKAGIKLWVLTGDKVETAINIGYSCSILNNEMRQLILQKYDEVNPIGQLDQYAEAMIVSGEYLLHIMNSIYRPLFIAKASTCLSVLCCRVSPLQKQEVVMAVRQCFPDISTLAIGDGANDVSMITSAHVGVGIKGVEGQQAARSSDYAIGEFQILRSLMLVHGRECYRRNAQLILYNFYKNVLMVFPQFWFACYNRFSGTSPYDPIIYQLYNLFYTSMPIIIYCVFDEEMPRGDLMNNLRQAYSNGLNNASYNTKQFTKWILIAIIQSTILSFFSFNAFEESTYKGRYVSYYETGTMIFGLSIVIANFKVVLITHTYNIATVFFLLGMIGMYFFTLLVFYKYTSYEGVYQIFDKLFPNASFYLANLLILGSTTFLDYGFSKLNKQKQYQVFHSGAQPTIPSNLKY